MPSYLCAGIIGKTDCLSKNALMIKILYVATTVIRDFVNAFTDITMPLCVIASYLAIERWRRVINTVSCCSRWVPLHSLVLLALHYDSVHRTERIASHPGLRNLKDKSV